MKRLLFAAVLAAPSAIGQDLPIKCEFTITYLAADPTHLAFTVPDKRCDVSSMRSALSYLLYRLK